MPEGLAAEARESLEREFAMKYGFPCPPAII